MDGIFDRRALPESHVIILVAARDKERFGVADLVDNERVTGCGTILGDDGFSRIDGTETKDVWIIGVCSSRADHNEISTARFADHPLEGSIYIGPATHQQ
jgi:hypothetical protein